MPWQLFGGQSSGRNRSEDAAQAAHRRCGVRLVEVEHIGFDPHRLVDVVGIDDLVRVADRLRLPVLHYRDRHLEDR
jgi:hypothetical protein